MNVNGTGVKQLTPKDLISNLPTYSPDGAKIAFQGGDFSVDIFTMNADGSDITKIAGDLVSPGNCVNACVMVDWGAEPVEREHASSQPDLSVQAPGRKDDRTWRTKNWN